MTPQLDQQDDRGAGEVAVAVEHLGGIDACRVEFAEGVTLLTGRNATNRTSLLRSLAGVLGGDAATLKSDADTGRVELSLGEETYVREYRRTGDGVAVQGAPFVEQASLVDCFVSVLETNPVRLAVERGDDLRPVVMRPVDTAAIERRIDELGEERQAVAAELQDSRERRESLPELESRRGDLEAELATVESELETLRAEVADAEATLEGAGASVDELDEAREERRELRQRMDVAAAEVEALRETVDDLETERAALPDAAAGGGDDVERELEAVRDRKRRLDDLVASLTTVVEFNEDVLSGEALPPGVAPEGSAPADGLAPEAAQPLVCWTCGSEVRRAAVEERLDDLRTVAEETRRERAELAERAADLEEERTHVGRVAERRRELDRKLDENRATLAEREAALEALAAEAAALDDRIETLEADVAGAEGVEEADLLETYEALSERRYDRHRLEAELASVKDDIAAVEATPEPAALETRLDELAAELERERNRVEAIETRVVEGFNEHMAGLLDVLEYDNLARVWLERKPDEGGSAGARFELHVVRETDDGSGYEDRLDHLSESERAVVGLVVTLAGYLAHEVADEVPFMLLDSLEAIDAARIEGLVEYFAGNVPYLVVALLPEDAAALPAAYDRVTADALAG